MVSTRASSVGVSLPPQDDEASAKPTRRSPRKSEGKSLVPVVTPAKLDHDEDEDEDEASLTTLGRATSRRSTRTKWSHTPTHLTLLWLALSLPLVIWDTIYILNRPHTMPGGKWHKPLWVPYGIYVNVDYVYGFPALEQNDGWPSAQGAGNTLETLSYLVYLYWAWAYGVDERGSAKKRVQKKGAATGLQQYLFEPRRVDGVLGARMVLILFATSVMTVGKTVLYWLIEYYNNFAHIGHNNFSDLFWLWIVPNGLWIIFPSFMIYSSASDIVRGLSMAAGVTDRKPQGKLM